MNKLRENMMATLAIIGVFAPLVLLGILIYKGQEPTALVAGFIGMILGSYPMIFQYYFGSSSGSKAKQDTIDKMTVPAATETALEIQQRLWKESKSTDTFEVWIEAKKTAYAAAGVTITFEEWLKTQK